MQKLDPQTMTGGKTKKQLSRAGKRDLDIEIQFLEGLVRKDPAYEDALELLGDDYAKRGRVGEGLGVDLKLLSLRPNDPRVLFNLACSYSIKGRLRRAADSLKQALESGYDDFRSVSRDPDLKRLRASKTLYPPIREWMRRRTGSVVFSE